eukprot:SAG31_NODE_7544_length_1659_cov_1.489103_1_plen_95_part_10
MIPRIVVLRDSRKRKSVLETHRISSIGWYKNPGYCGFGLLPGCAHGKLTPFSLSFATIFTAHSMFHFAQLFLKNINSSLSWTGKYISRLPINFSF